MFDDKNLQKDDALAKRLERLSGSVKPSPALMKAAKTGVPLRSMGIRYTAGMHIRRVSKAVLLYAACVAILLGGVFLLPKLFENSDPVVTQPEEMLSPGTVAEMVFSETNVTYTMESTSWKGNTTIQRMIRDGDKLYYYQSGATERYYDVVRSMGYSYDKQNGVWVKNKAEGITWEILCANYFAGEYFNDYDYEEMNGYYQITESGLANLIGAGVYHRTICDFTLKNGVYTFRLIRNDEEGNVYSSFIIEISFGTASVTLPDAKQCEHRYIGVQCAVCGEVCSHDFVTTDDTPSCTEGIMKESTCFICGYSQSSWLEPLGHDYVDFVCTRCGDLGDPEVPPPADCEHGQDLTTCPYCNCAGHEFADNTCTKCGLVCQHEYSEVFPNGICTKCGTECTHNYSDDTCNAVCTLCGKLQVHNYEEIVSTDRICTEGTVTTTACRRCGYSYTETTPAIGHSYDSKGVCTVCGEVKKAVTVTDSKVTAGSVSLLPGQMYQTYPSLKGDGFTWVDPTMTPYYYNVYTYFGGYTVTDIRVPVYRAEKGSVLTIGVARVENGIITDRIAFYELTADRSMSGEWVLFSGLSIVVPEGCTLTFGWMSDTLWYTSPVSGHIPGYSQQDDYSGMGSQIPLIFDVYGKKN